MRRFLTPLLIALLVVGLLPGPVLAAVPTASSAGATTLEDEAVAVTLSASDDDGDETTQFTIVVAPDTGTLGTIGAITCDGLVPNECTAEVTYTPDADTNGTDGFTFTAFAGGEDSAEASASITVEAVNDAPSFTKGDDQQVAEDAGAQTVTGWATNLSAGPVDEEGTQLLSFSLSSDNPGLFASAPAVDGVTGTLTFTPAANASGSASVSVTLTDDGGTANGGDDTSDAQSFTITVTGENDPPVADDDSATLVEDTPQAIAVLDGDTDPDGGTLTVTGATGATKGTLSITGDGTTVTYTPSANAVGADTFTYTVSDGNGGTDTGTVSVTITAVNDAPSFAAGANVVVKEDEAAFSASWATGISMGPVDEAGQSGTFTVTAVVPSLFSVQPEVSPSGTLTFTPAPNAFGSTFVDVVLTDTGGTANGGLATSATVRFTITIAAVNDAPSFTKGPNSSVFEDFGTRTWTGWATGISAGPANESAQALNFTVTNDNPSLFSVQPAVAANGTLTYAPAANRNGSANVTVRLSDSGGTSNGGADTSPSQNFVITVVAVNDPPIAANDIATVAGILPAALNVRANDSGGPNEPADTYLITSVTQGTKGTVTITGGGTGITYDPIRCSTGTDTFTYTTRDAAGLTDAATVLVTINPLTTAPQADAPESAFVLNSTIGTTIPVRTTWCATDPGPDVRSYQLQRKVNTGTFSTQTLPSQLTTGLTQSLTAGYTYAYRMRATDTLGRVGAFATGPSFRVLRTQDSSTSAITYTGTWRSASSTSASGGTTRYATAAGARATMAFSGRAVAIVAPKSSTRGSFRVYVDNVLVGTVSLRSTTSLSKRVVFARTLAPGAHTIRIEVVGNGRVDLDAILVLS